MTPLTPPTHDSAIPTPVQTLLDLFANELSAVKFPGLDASVLSDAATQVASRAAEVSRLESELAAARLALGESQEALSHKAQRALSYARVYAEEDPELSARLDAVGPLKTVRKGNRTEVPGAEAEAAPAEGRKRRGRPRSSGLLFTEEQGNQADTQEPAEQPAA